MIDQETVIAEAASHARLSEAEINSALLAILDAINTYLAIGHPVQLNNLGTLRPTVSAKAVNDEKDCVVGTMKGFGINFLPIGKFARLIKDLKFRVVGVDIENPDETEDPNNSEENDGKFTVTYQHKGSTITTQKYAEGERVVEPEAPEEGWIWGNTPSVMPARDVTVTSVEDE